VGGVPQKAAHHGVTMSPWLLFSLLLTLVVSTATLLQPRALAWTSGKDSNHLMKVLLGDGRRILANHMFVQADVYFHSGYYPSVFDQQFAPKNSSHMTSSQDESESNHQHQEGVTETKHQEAEDEHEKAMAFLKEPKDWIEKFGRKFMISEHQHLGGGKEREMLPWLKLSAELDPQRVETYTVAAYWLSRTLGKPKEAEEFLRVGLKANPRSYEILFELGALYYDVNHDVNRGRNLWEAAFARWEEQESTLKNADLFTLDQILLNLARLEQQQGDYQKAIHWLETAIAKDASRNPDALKKQIQEIREKLKQK
jgi:tetratricopeptide (TPR) repeat protein